MKDQLKYYRRELKDELRNILNYWMTNAIDDDHGGFYSKINHFNQVEKKAPKGAVLNARILWTFSAAYNNLHEEQYLDIAHRAYHYLKDFFYDKNKGGLFWEVDYLGNPLNTRKRIYAQGFGIYSFSEYYKASENNDSLAMAKSLFQSIEEHSYDPVYSGYLEAFDQQWKILSDMRLSEKDENFSKSMNTHLHILESYTNLYRVWKDEKLAKRIKELINVFLNFIIEEKTAHFNLFFERNWDVKSNVVSYGHDIEGAWLLTEAAELLGNPELLNYVRQTAIKMINAAISDGMDVDGSLYYELERATGHLDTDRHWWPQAEAMVGLMDAFEITGDKIYFEKSMNTWQFVRRFMIDKEHGEWYWRVDERRIPDEREDKAGSWKCPYHNSRACMEIMRRIEAIDN